MTGLHYNNLEEYKIKASILLKTLRSADSEKALDAALRFRCLPHLANFSPQEIVLHKEKIRLKHALTVIAIENKYASWPDFKRYLEKREAIRARRNYTSLYPRRCAGFLNEWYTNYEVAYHQQQQIGGYLLPYQDQFFICTRDYIKALGLDPDDLDWQCIGWNWVRPADQEAWQRLNSKLKGLELNYSE
ncbi:MAG: hypothetical protein AB1489_37125 [Acidobacteriota bacterium]